MKLNKIWGLTNFEIRHLETYRDNIRKELWDNLLLSIIFGSFPYEPDKKSDIDILVLLKKNITKKTLTKLKLLYNQLHKSLGKKPDTEFPWEYIKTHDLKQALLGKWFYIDEKWFVDIPSIQSNQRNNFNEFRHHIWAIWSSTLLLSWDKSLHKKYTKASLESLIKTIILSSKFKDSKIISKELLINEIIGPGKECLWFSNNKTNRNKLEIVIDWIFKQRKKSNLITKCHNWKYIIDKNNNSFKRHLDRIKTFSYMEDKKTL